MNLAGQFATTRSISSLPNATNPGKWSRAEYHFLCTLLYTPVKFRRAHLRKTPREGIPLQLDLDSSNLNSLLKQMSTFSNVQED